MTQAERLIRNLCAVKLQQILEAERTLLRTSPTHLPWKQVPSAVRTLLTEYRATVNRMEILKARIHKAGFEVYNSRPGKKVNLSNPGEIRAGISRAAESKRARLKALQTQATISSMGQPPEKQRIVLEELQKVLKQV